MKEPERLLRMGATDFERSLLESVQNERPPPELTARMERALGIAVGVGLSALTHAGASQAAVSRAAVSQTAVQTAAGSVAPVAGIGGASGNVAAGSAIGGKVLGANVAAGVAVKAGIGAVLGTGLVVSAVTFLPEVVSRGPESHSAAPSFAPAPEASAPAVLEGELEPAASAAPLREEIVLLDEARAALARGNAAGARSALERYRSSFPRGALLREARVLWARAGAGPWQAGGNTSGAGGASRR